MLGNIKGTPQIYDTVADIVEPVVAEGKCPPSVLFALKFTLSFANFVRYLGLVRHKGNSAVASHLLTRHAESSAFFHICLLVFLFFPPPPISIAIVSGIFSPLNVDSIDSAKITIKFLAFFGFLKSLTLGAI